MLTDDQLTDIATLHLAAKQDGDTWDMLPLLRDVAKAQVAVERERCAKLCDPSNAGDPEDWTEYAKTRAECAARIRGA